MAPPGDARQTRVLIVGAGIGGLVLAAGLDWHGITATFVEIGNASLSLNAFPIGLAG